LQHAGYALLALAVMTKGPIAFALVGMALALGWIAGGDSRRAVAALSWKTGFAAALVVASPWFIWMYSRFGQEFIRGYFLAGHLSYLEPRSSVSSFTHTFYVQMFFTAFFPWSLVTFGYGIDTLRRRSAGTSPSAGETLLWAWMTTVLVVFTLVRFRVDRYIYPAAPACCLLAARAWMAARDAKDAREYLATRLSILASAVILAGLGITLAVNLPRLGLNIPPTAFVLPMALALGGIAVVVTMTRHGLVPPAVTRIPVTMMVIAYATIVALGLPAIEQGRPIKQVGRWIQSQSTAGDFVGLYGLDRWESSLRYYAERPLRRIASGADARAFLSEPGRGWLVMRKQEYDALLAEGKTGPIAYEVPAVVGNAGRGIRRQIWSEVVVVRKSAEP
jgi:4-amino-4-deoxy-L-arabinose transferase-like glycosyltransferase